MPIGEITLPERLPQSRKYSEQDGSTALELIESGKVAGDGQQYDSEDKARSSAASLKRAVAGAALRRGDIEPPSLTAKVREVEPGAFVFGLSARVEGDTSDDGPSDGLDSKNREQLNEIARDLGAADDPDDLPNKQAVIDAIRRQGYGGDDE